jgi:hypothetical protein
MARGPSVRIRSEGARETNRDLRSLAAQAEDTAARIRRAGQNLRQAWGGVRTGIQDVGSALASTTGRVAAFSAGLTAALAGATTAANRLVSSVAAVADEQIKAARSVGLSVEEFQRLEFVLSQGGVGARQARRTLIELQRDYQARAAEAADAAKRQADALRDGASAQRELNRAEERAEVLRRALEGGDRDVAAEVQRRIRAVDARLRAGAQITAAERASLEAQRRALNEAARGPEASRRLLERLLSEAERDIPRLQAAVERAAAGIAGPEGSTDAAVARIQALARAEDQVRASAEAATLPYRERIRLINDEAIALREAYRQPMAPEQRRELDARLRELREAIRSDAASKALFQRRYREAIEEYQRAAGVQPAAPLSAAVGSTQDLARALRGAGEESASLVDRLLKIADEIAALPDDLARSARLVQEFGPAVGPQLVSVLRGGARAFRDQFELADRIQGTRSTEAAEAAEAYNDTVDQFRRAIEAVKRVVAEPLTPIFTQFFGALRDRIAESREQIGALVRDMVGRFQPVIDDLFRLLRGESAQTPFVQDLIRRFGEASDAVRQFAADFRAVAEEVVLPAARAVRDVLNLVASGLRMVGVEATGGQVAIALVITKILGGFTLIGAALRLIGGLGKMAFAFLFQGGIGAAASAIGTALTTAVGALRSMIGVAGRAATAVGGVARAAGDVASRAVGTATGRGAGFAGRVASVAAGGAASGAAAGGAAGGAGAAAATGARVGIAALGRLAAAGAALLTGPVGWAIGAVAVGVEVYRNWDTIVSVASIAWERIKGAASSTLTTISESVGPALETAWDDIKSAASTTWSNVISTASSAWSSISSAIGPVLEGAWESVKSGWASTLETLRSGWDSLSGYARSIWDRLVSGAREGARRVGQAVSGAAPGFATGGAVRGPGTGTSDSIFARLSNGEYVIRAAAVRRYGTAFLDAINSARLPGFADGGMIGAAIPMPAAAGASGAPGRDRFTLLLEGRRYGVEAVPDVVDALSAHLRRRGLSSAGALPEWYR